MNLPASFGQHFIIGKEFRSMVAASVKTTSLHSADPASGHVFKQQRRPRIFNGPVAYLRDLEVWIDAFADIAKVSGAPQFIHKIRK